MKVDTNKLLLITILAFMCIIFISTILISFAKQDNVYAVLETEKAFPPPNTKVAFIADQGSGDDARAVLRLIREENADMVLIQGDLDNDDKKDADAWEQMMYENLGQDIPFFASLGNHDFPIKDDLHFKLLDRLAKTPGVKCVGKPGLMLTCTYKGLFFVLSGVGVITFSNVDHDDYVERQLSSTNYPWRICSWHLNQREMQLGSRGNTVGWSVYEACREAGALIVTGHEHSYHRTHILNNTRKQIVADNTSPYTLKKGQTMIIVSGLGGKDIRSQLRCKPTTPPYGCKGEWAAVYTSDQGANYGALFCIFNVNGEENKAHCYFKDIDGNIPDEFDIINEIE